MKEVKIAANNILWQVKNKVFCKCFVHLFLSRKHGPLYLLSVINTFGNLVILFFNDFADFCFLKIIAVNIAAKANSKKQDSADEINSNLFFSHIFFVYRFLGLKF